MIKSHVALSSQKKLAKTIGDLFFARGLCLALEVIGDESYTTTEKNLSMLVESPQTILKLSEDGCTDVKIESEIV